MALQSLCARHVALLIVLRAIEFDDQLEFFAVEIDDVWWDGVLATELELGKTFCAQVIPELDFGVGAGSAQRLGRSQRSGGQGRFVAHGFDRTLSPTPLPVGEGLFKSQNVPASLKIGRYRAITMPPTRVPSTTMMSGSSRVERVSTALLTSSS